MTLFELQHIEEQTRQKQSRFASKLVKIIRKHDIYEFLRLQDECNYTEKWLLAESISKEPFIGTELRTITKAHAGCCSDEYYFFELPTEIFNLDIDSPDITQNVNKILDKWLAKLKLEDEYKQKLRELDEPN